MGGFAKFMQYFINYLIINSSFNNFFIFSYLFTTLILAPIKKTQQIYEKELNESIFIYVRKPKNKSRKWQMQVV